MIDLYGGTQHIPLYQMSGFYGKVTHTTLPLPEAPRREILIPRSLVLGMVAESELPPQGPSIKQFMDIFSLPEMALLSCVVDYFLGHGLEFDQVHLYKDVTVRGCGDCPLDETKSVCNMVGLPL